MLRHIAIVGLAAASFATIAAPAYATAGPGPVSVTYTVDPDNSFVAVGTAMPGQPLFGAYVNGETGKACTGFSYQMPFCVQSPVVTNIETG
ncbi:MAG: hypothetical protein LC640_12540 [Frankia sp.]|nr:hypothetical protein [Frankia sp.]